MLRLRSAYLALASGVLMTLSGCLNTNSCDSGGGMFPRLFRSARPTVVSGGVGGFDHDCECHSAHMPRTFDVPPGQGPFIGPPPAPMPPTSAPIPITTIPNTAPPIITRSPVAVPTPYNP